MLVRRAEDRDAGQAAAVIRRSITALCVADYKGDGQVLTRWLANKTEANLRRWIGNAARTVYLAALDDLRIAGVGMVVHGGEIMLNYVALDARFQGVSKALMTRMETELRTLGVERVVLLSTQVARPFYRSLGYEEGQQVASLFGTLDTTEMAKSLG